jgi:hypothetical protein
MDKPKSLHPFPPVVLVGAGGVGSFLLPTLLRTIRNHSDPDKSPGVVVFDGDTLEKRNMERQLFDDSDVGSNKAEALVSKYSSYYPNLRAMPEYFTGQEEFDQPPLVICCVDNHPGRLRVLEACDLHRLRCILCGNGYTDAEAFFYHPDWKGTKLDPRRYYPEIATTHTGDPLAPVGCTGEAQAAAPQLAIANFMAAGYGLHLLWIWTQEVPGLTKEAREYAAFHHISNFNKIQTKLRKDHE